VQKGLKNILGVVRAKGLKNITALPGNKKVLGKLISKSLVGFWGS
jgi:hypothetical protein